MISKEFEAFLEYIIVTKALSKNTIKAYESDLKQMEEKAKKPLIELDNAEVLKLLLHVDNKHSLNRKLSTLNAFFNFCHKSHFSEDKLSFRLSKVPSKLPQFLEYKEVQNGLSLIDKEKVIGLRDYALILMLYATGMRISEMLALKLDDIESGWIRVREAKGDKERMIPVAPQALDAMDNYINALAVDRDRIWLNYQNKPLSRISAFKICKKYLNVSPHVLRHSYATALIVGGADLRVVQELLGHASLLTTQIYTHIQKQNLAQTMEQCHPMAQGQT